MNFISIRKHRTIRIATTLVCVAWAILTTGVLVCAGTPFSFVALGDTRTEPYLSGGDKKGAYGETWTSDYPDFEAQMAFLTSELRAAKNTGADHVFVVYHKPSFVKVGHDPLSKDRNPHIIIKEFAKDLNIIVFNSHTHTTEHYLVDGVNYLVLGAGGAPQAFDLTANPSPEKELYWKGKSTVEEYNYLQVTVDSVHIKGIIHRFRPNDTMKPFSVEEVFGE